MNTIEVPDVQRSGETPETVVPTGVRINPPAQKTEPRLLQLRNCAKISYPKLGLVVHDR